MSPRRCAIIGDVHGCVDEFMALTMLLEAQGITKDDRVILLGDLLDKGPDPLGCLRFARAQGYEAVASNHEERHARWWRRERSGKPNKMKPFHDDRDRLVNEALTEAEVVWMETRPAWLEVIPGVVAVHGGFQPGIPLAQQDPTKVIRLRYVDATGKHLPTDYEAPGGPVQPAGSFHWSELWEGPERVSVWSTGTRRSASACPGASRSHPRSRP